MNKRGDVLFIIWLSLFVLLSIIELVTINLVTIWFALGALVTMFCTLFINDTITLSSIFTFTSLIALISTKKFVKEFSKKGTIPTNTDRIIGKIGIVTQEISSLEPGEVKVDGKHWSAIASNKISKNEKVKILSIEGVKLKVEKIKEEN